jgi:hypothetical protein
MINEPINHDTPHPASASAGPDNAYYLRHCADIERGPAYAACLSRLHDIDKGVANERTSQCEKAVHEKRCIAAGMREQETLAGKALFYFPRSNKPFLPVQVAGDFGILITNLTDPALVPKKGAPAPARKPVAPAKTLDEHLTHATTAGFAEALNSAIADTPARSADEPAKPAPAITPKPAPVAAPQPPAQPAKPALAMLPGETPLQYARRRLAANTTKTEDA